MTSADLLHVHVITAYAIRKHAKLLQNCQRFPQDKVSLHAELCMRMALA